MQYSAQGGIPTHNNQICSYVRFFISFLISLHRQRLALKDMYRITSADVNFS